MKYPRVILFTLIISSIVAYSQPSKIMNAAEIKLAMQKLNVLGSVLYVAAHPDDENTAALAYFSLGKKYRTGYLSLTRGDGGQNLIGPEKGDLMGVIRTHELLEGRKIDGVEQFFTRAIDFGYSKTTEETLEFWGREKILEDVIWVIRKFKPDVIVTRFPPDGWQTHGHHLASAILAIEAFHKAADSNVFPDQLSQVETWQAGRIVWDSWLPRMQNFDGDLSSYIVEDIGGYSKLLGKSFTEISAESRTKHKSQGFGAIAARGKQAAYFKFLAGDSSTASLFDGIETGWTREQGRDKIEALVQKLNSEFDISRPTASVNDLTGLYTLLNNAKQTYWVEYHKAAVVELIQSCTGLWVEAIAADYTYTQGDSVNLSLSLINRSDVDLTLNRYWISNLFEEVTNKKLVNNEQQSYDIKVMLDDNQTISQPYWLTGNKIKNNFQSVYNDLTPAIEKPTFTATFEVNVNGVEFNIDTPVMYRWRDRVKGELYRDVEVRPVVTINPGKDIAIFADNTGKEIKMEVKSYRSNVSGKLEFVTSNGWQVTPLKVDFVIPEKYGIYEALVNVTPGDQSTESKLELFAVVDGKRFSHLLKDIEYDHIPTQSILFPSELKLVKVNTAKLISRIGYIEGAGDKVVEVLKSLGYNVDILNEERINQSDLSKYDAIVTGIRAYNTNSYLKHANKKLLDYVAKGGRLIVQYNVSFGLVTNKIGPYKFTISRDRVTDEASPVTIDSNHPLLNYPNKITETDFNNWVQERGLYFAGDWDSIMTPLIEWNDKGEEPKHGSLLYATYGEGEFIYTGISFFRQLPAGVPGAIRLFVNLITGEKNNG